MGRRRQGSKTSACFSMDERKYMGNTVKQQRNEEWERECDVGELGRGPIGEETDMPVCALDVGIDRGYEVITPRRLLGMIRSRSKAEYAVCVALVNQGR